MTKRRTRGIALLLACLMLLTFLPGAALAHPTVDLATPNRDVSTQTLGQPIGLHGFEYLTADPDEIIQVVVQFVTPSAVAQRLAYDGLILLSDSTFEARALEAHDTFREQLGVSLLGRSGLEIYSEHHSLFNGVFMRVPAGMVREIADLPEVFSVSPAPRVQVVDPIRPLSDDLAIDDFMRESLALFDIDYIHNTLGFTGDGLRVAVLDTGIDYNHPVFTAYQNPTTGRIRGRNFTTDNPNDIMDVVGHGTHVSGTVVALAPDIELWHYKVFDDFGGADIDWITSGIEAAHRDGMDVMNLSLGAMTDDPFFVWNVATNLAMLDGVMVVNAAGNEGDWLGMHSVRAPGLASLPITVGSGTAGGRNDLGDQMSDFSSLGPVFGTYHLAVDIVAPGSDIVSALPGGSFEPNSGTSMAAPHVAGIAALMIEAFPNAPTDEIKARMMNTARPLAIPSPYGVHASGAGFIDPIAALQSSSFATVRHNIPWLTGTTQGWREATMASLSFGTIWNRTESNTLTVTINNPGAGAWTPTTQWDGMHTGVTLELISSNTAGAAHTFTYQMRFATTAADGLYAGRLLFTNGDQRITLPFGAQFTRTIDTPVAASALLEFQDMTDGDVLPESIAVLTLMNTGDVPTGPVQVSLTGSDSEIFSIAEWFLPEGSTNVTSQSFTIPSIGQGFWAEFAVYVDSHLSVGSYTVTVEFSGTGFTRAIDLDLNVLPFPFLDVSFDSWYFAAVSLARQLGLMNGVAPDRFAPLETMNRAMAATIFHRLLGEPSMDGIEPFFDDVSPSRWYYDAVQFAAAFGIMEGVGGGRFNPNDTITREQFATILFRFSYLLGEDMSIEDEDILQGFNDYADISNWAVEALRWLVHEEIIAGTPEGYLNPGRGTNRAEAATMWIRWFGFPV